MQDQLRSHIRRNSEMIEKLIARGEIAALALCLVGVFLMMQRVSPSMHLILTGISLLAFIYAFHGNFLSEIFNLQKSDLTILAVRGGYIALAVTTMGILFTLQKWPGGKIMLLTGCSVTAVFFLFLLYKLYIGKLEDSRVRLLINNLIVRMLPALLIVGFLLSAALRM